jgi:predicted phosphodiesterase
VNKIKALVLLLPILVISACQPEKYPAQTITSNLVPSLTSTYIDATSISSPEITPTPLPQLDLLKGPYMVFGQTPMDVTVLWQDAARRDFTFEWGSDLSYSFGSTEPVKDPDSGIYRMELQDLNPGIKYVYRISADGAEANGSFYTPVTDSETLTFWAYGDTRSGPEIHDQIASEILNQISSDPLAQTFVLSTGDLMNTAEETSLQENEFSLVTPHIRQLQASLPVVNVMGNHDGTAIFKKYFPYPYTDTFDWSFDYGPAHFTVIDQYIDLAVGTRRYGWLENDLASSRKPWKVILLHEPGWSAGPHPNNETIQNLIQPLAERYGVDLVIAGHNHYFARATVQGVTHLTTGGGGAQLYEPGNGWSFIQTTISAYHFLKLSFSGLILTVEIISPAGELLESFTIDNKE